MYKKLLLICLLFLLTSCKKIEYTTEYIQLVNDCLKDSHNYNDVALGYKYYVPKGVKKVQDYDYNQVFLVDGSHIYLYVDIVSYFYKMSLQESNKDDVYYYQPIKNGDKSGYLLIDNVDEDYLISMVYNYSKIQVYTTKDNINKIVTLSAIILNSIEYNDNVINKVLEGNLGQFSEFTYEVDKPDDASSNFSQFLEEYVQKEEVEKLPDE